MSQAIQSSVDLSELSALSSQLEALTTLRDGWNSHGSAAPNRQALDHAKTVLDRAAHGAILPSKIVASAEGGIGLCFTSDCGYCDIECLNNGDIVAVKIGLDQQSHVWAITPNLDEIDDAIVAIRTHLNG